jgi:hypothetical protein
MKRRLRAVKPDTWLMLVVAMILVVSSAAAAIRETQKQEKPPLDSASNQPDGARALRLWLEELGYQAPDEPQSQFSVPPETRLALILEPSYRVTDPEWEILDEWVDAGGVLVLAGQSLSAYLAFQRYGFTLSSTTPVTAPLRLESPWFRSPPVTTEVDARPRYTLQGGGQNEGAGFVSHLALEDGAVLVSLRQGAGRVILSATSFPFSNAGLKAAGNPELVLNLLALAGQPGRVWFDEWHHGQRAAVRQISGPGEWLRYTPGGRALLFLTGMLLAALLLHGRNFGRPAPLLKDLSRRSPLENITALANLYRRAGRRQAALQHIRQQLKRELGQRYRIDPTLPDDEYIALLQQARPGLDAPALASLLNRLGKTSANEREFVQLARQAASWTKERD